jgi:hypothetical protein
MTSAFHRPALLIALAVATIASSADARSATAHLITCDAGNCLLVRGHRASPQAIVRINGRTVEASGDRSWQVRLPVATVRDWSAPFARNLQVAVVDPAGPVERADAVRLPVGLLGHNLELASLVVRPN